MIADEQISQSLQETLNRIAAKAVDRKEEIVDLLSKEQPGKSKMVESNYLHCTWWEGCYYCQDKNHVWHRVQCCV